MLFGTARRLVMIERSLLSAKGHIQCPVSIIRCYSGCSDGNLDDLNSQYNRSLFVCPQYFLAIHTYKQIYIAPKSWKRIRGADRLRFEFMSAGFLKLFFFLFFFFVGEREIACALQTGG